MVRLWRSPDQSTTGSSRKQKNRRTFRDSDTLHLSPKPPRRVRNRPNRLQAPEQSRLSAPRTPKRTLGTSIRKTLPRARRTLSLSEKSRHKAAEDLKLTSRKRAIRAGPAKVPVMFLRTQRRATTQKTRRRNSERGARSKSTENKRRGRLRKGEAWANLKERRLLVAGGLIECAQHIVKLHCLFREFSNLRDLAPWGIPHHRDLIADTRP